MDLKLDLVTLNLDTLDLELGLKTELEFYINANIKNLLHKYQNNPYIIQRLETYILKLDDVLERDNKLYIERETRINNLTNEQNIFSKVFLSKNQYFYMPFNNMFYEYDGKIYKKINEDIIHHKLLSTITDEAKLIQWKHKTTQNILKKIKERPLYKSVPETYTIQQVLSFLQTIFQTKEEVKYFLTIIGDCILKKNNHLLYFVSSNFKKIIAEIDSIINITTGNSIINKFITKYHDNHTLSIYRLIKTNDIAETLSINIIKNILNNIGIDLFCVATHYSDRYENSDNYLNIKLLDELKRHVLYFVDNPIDKIITEFISQCIETTDNESVISWKNIHYIWKLYLSNLQIPNMIYSSQLQELLMKKMNYITNKNDTICFTNITSKYLPVVSSFLSFWNKHITILNNPIIDYEYEIDELITLYKFYDKKTSQLSDKQVIQIIKHFYSYSSNTEDPKVEVIDNKYITNICCNLWDKNNDVNDFLQAYKSYTHKTNKMNNVVNENTPLNTNTNTDSDTDSDTDIISFDDLYKSYRIYVNTKTSINNEANLIVSKHFFEKCLVNKLTEFIRFDSFVSSLWLKQ